MSPQADLFRAEAVSTAQAHAERFPDDFLIWLPGNLHVWEAFAREARAVRAKGFEHYSARTIIEFLRHHTALEQRSLDDSMKLNDKYTPYLARLFDLAYPDKSGLFEYRKTKKVAHVQHSIPSPTHQR